MTTTFPPGFFDRVDASDDARFYAAPRLVQHIDEGAIAAVGEVYAALGVEGDVLDLMSSWVSHLRARPRHLTVLGMNADELAANPMADRAIQHDLNADPKLPLPDAGVDAAVCTVSVDYLTRPVEVFGEVARVLRPGGVFACTFSNRCFPTKAIRGWLATDDEGHVAIVSAYFRAAGGFDEPRAQRADTDGDPLFAVSARRTGNGAPEVAVRLGMGLTIATGPLSRRAPETRNFSIAGPAHSLLLEPFGRRVRAEVGGVTVLDSERGALLHETGLLPQLYVPSGDIAAGEGVELVPTDTTTHCPFKGDASYASLRVGDRTVPDAVWSYRDPIPASSWLAGLSALPFAAADRWFDEDDEVIGHLTDPYHRVDLRRTSRRIVVTTADGAPVADTGGSAGALLVAETGLPSRWYLPRAAVSATLRPSQTRTTCAYKGHATYADVLVGDHVVTDAAWSYEEPLAAVRGLAGLVCLAHDELVVTVS